MYYIHSRGHNHQVEIKLPLQTFFITKSLKPDVMFSIIDDYLCFFQSPLFLLLNFSELRPLYYEIGSIFLYWHLDCMHAFQNHYYFFFTVRNYATLLSINIETLPLDWINLLNQKSNYFLKLKHMSPKLYNYQLNKFQASLRDMQPQIVIESQNSS